MAEWTRHKIFEFARNVESGMVVAWGIRAQRSCGCEYRMGIRTDNGESVFGAVGCDQHKDKAAKAVYALQSLPPEDTELGEMYEREFERG